jgi:hypothetical protein
MGSKLIPKDLVHNHDFDGLARQVAATVAAVEEARS